MEVRKTLVKQLRIDKGWTQQQLADVTNLSLRTIQRVEKLGVASMESTNALCAVFDIKRRELLLEKSEDSLRAFKNTLPLRLKIAFLLVFLGGAAFGALNAFLIFSYS